MPSPSVFLKVCVLGNQTQVFELATLVLYQPNPQFLKPALYAPYISHLKIPVSEALMSLYCFLKIHTCYWFLHVGAVSCILPLGCTSQEFLGPCSWFCFCWRDFCFASAEIGDYPRFQPKVFTGLTMCPILKIVQAVSTANFLHSAKVRVKPNPLPVCGGPDIQYTY